MKTRKQTKYIHEGRYAAEVDVELIVTNDEWAPYLSLQDAYKERRKNNFPILDAIIRSGKP